MQSHYLEQAFEHGTIMHCWEHEVTPECVEIGDLYLPTGHIVACDPLTLWQAAPFIQTVQPGHYPVSLSLIKLPDERWKHVALAKVTFKNERPIAWKMALKPGQDVAELGEDEFFGYGVDTGTGAFLDAQTVEPLQSSVKTHFDDMVETLSHTCTEPTKGATIRLDDATGINFAAFSSGFGDGSYPSYWGYDVDGGVVCLVTDFGLLTG